MKNKLASVQGRATFGALFVIIGFVFAVVAILPTDSQSAQRRTGKKQQAAAPVATAAISPAPAPAIPDYIGFENFEGPGVLTDVITSSQGSTAHTVEYIAHDAGEPSIGVNWKTNVTAFQSDFQTLFVTFDDSCNLAAPKANWRNSQAPTAQGADQDPIGFVDRVTGRTFSAQLTLTSPTCKTSYTD